MILNGWGKAGSNLLCFVILKIGKKKLEIEELFGMDKKSAWKKKRPFGFSKTDKRIYYKFIIKRRN